MRFIAIALLGAAVSAADQTLYSSPAQPQSTSAAVGHKLRSSSKKEPVEDKVSTEGAKEADQRTSINDDEVGGDAVNPSGSPERANGYSYEGNDYPGADHGVLVALPRRPIGTIPPYDQDDEVPELIGDAEHVQANHAVDTKRKWDVPRQMQPYYEWMIAQARGNRYAFPEPTVQMLEQLEEMLADFNRGNVREIEVIRRGLQAAGAAGAAAQSALNSGAQSAANAAGNAANVAGSAANNVANAAGSAVGANGLPVLDADSVNNIFNAISNSMANVASAAGQAVGVPTTTPPPFNQALLGLLSILQGFQKLAVAAGSVGVNQIAPVSA